MSWQSERKRGSEEGRKGERARYSAKVKRGERKEIQKNRAKERDGAQENSDPTRPTGSPASARISCSATPHADSSRFSLMDWFATETEILHLSSLLAYRPLKYSISL